MHPRNHVRVARARCTDLQVFLIQLSSIGRVSTPQCALPNLAKKDPLFCRVGVLPVNLSQERQKRCKELISEDDITGVEVAVYLHPDVYWAEAPQRRLLP